MINLLHAHLINLWSLISGRWLHLKRYTKSNDLISPDSIMIKHLASKITYWKKKIAVHCSQGRNIAQMLRGFMLFIFDFHGKWRDCKFFETDELLYFRRGDWSFFFLIEDSLLGLKTCKISLLNYRLRDYMKI